MRIGGRRKFETLPRAPMRSSKIYETAASPISVKLSDIAVLPAPFLTRVNR
jgi:hypothetical protein